MGGGRLQGVEGNRDVLFSTSGLGFQWSPHENCFHPGGLFASVSKVGMGVGISPISPNSHDNVSEPPFTNMFAKYSLMPESGYEIVGIPEMGLSEIAEEEVLKNKKKKKRGALKMKIKIGNPSLRRLFSGATAGVVSRTAVAPLETIRTHLMVGSCGNSTSEVFQNIMKNDGWKGLFKAKACFYIRQNPISCVVESDIIYIGFNTPPILAELFAYDTVKKHLTPKPGEQPKLPFPTSPIAGAIAGVSSTLCTYPLKLLKTRLTVQRGADKNLLDALFTIVRDEGPAELYRGLTPSLIGVIIPYAATNYFAYDALQRAYKKAFNREEIGYVMTLLIGSTAGAISGSAAFPLEVARKHMQAGALKGRQYQNVLHALASILETEGLIGLYKGTSCMKLVPAAGISFMCYEACKRVLIEKEDD